MTAVLPPSRSNPPKGSQRRSLLLALGLLCFFTACRDHAAENQAKDGAKQKRPDQSPQHPEKSAKLQRIVSLSPGLTESLLYLKRGDALVAVSDYCHLPDGLELPRVGSGFSPNYESIARQQPDMVLTTVVAGDQLRPLQRLAPTVMLPWLEMHEMKSSLLRLGQLVEREQEAQALANRLETELGKPAPPHAPRVLWALDPTSTGDAQTWYIRDNSLHGAALRAAGAANALPKPISGKPLLSPEELLQVDPDVILVVVSPPAPPVNEEEYVAEKRSVIVRHFSRLRPLRAVSRGRLVVTAHPQAMSLGPGVLELVNVLHKALGLPEDGSGATSPGVGKAAE